MSTPEPQVAEVRMPKRYRRFLYVGIFLFGLASLIGGLVAIGPAATAARHAAVAAEARTRSDEEMLCRAKISNVLQAANTDASAALNDIVLALARQLPTLPLVPAFQEAVDRQKAVAAIAVHATASCHTDPTYLLPANLIPDGGS